MAPEAQRALGWIERLERSQRLVTEAARRLSGDLVPTVDLAPAARAMERALISVFDAFDRRGPCLESAQRARDELRSAIAVLQSESADLEQVRACAATLSDAADQVAEAEKSLQSTAMDPKPNARREMLASGDTPRLHVLERPSLTMSVRVAAPRRPLPEPPAPLPRPKTFDELHANAAELKRRNVARGLQREAAAARAELEAIEAEAAALAAVKPPPPGFDPDVRAALDERAFIRERTRYHLEEVAMLGTQRAPMFGDRWRDVLILEQRMLRAIDVIVSMGPEAVACLEPLVFDAPAKDATRVFAIAMIMGCVQGRDALAAAERVFLDFERVDPGCGDALASALKLVPHDQLTVWLYSLLSDPEPRHRAVAIDVLGHRGLATEDELAAAAADVALVSDAALPHLALLAPQRAGPIIDHAMADTARDQTAIWLSMALSGHGATRMTLTAAVKEEREVTDEQRGHAALLLALCGDRNDGTVLQEQARRAPTPALVDALGWVGDPSAFPLLLDLLGHDDEEVGWAAGSALDRITGAWLIEHVDLEAEDIYVEIPPDPKTGIEEPKLAKKVSDPRDVPPEPAKETVEQPCRDPERWRAWLEEHGSEIRDGKRYRRGYPYVPRTTLEELDTFPCLLADRQALVWELVIRTGAFVRMSPHDLVRVQEEALKEWLPHASRGNTPGTWNRPGRS